MTHYLADYVVSFMVSYYMVSHFMVSHVVMCMISRLMSEPPDRISSGEPAGHIAGEVVGRDGFK